MGQTRTKGSNHFRLKCSRKLIGFQCFSWKKSTDSYIKNAWIGQPNWPDHPLLPALTFHQIIFWAYNIYSLPRLFCFTSLTTFFISPVFSISSINFNQFDLPEPQPKTEDK